MKETLVRFGVAMEAPLLAALDAIVEERGGTRSELLRDLVRAEVTRARVREPVSAVATITIVYDHHVRDLTERLNEFQHSLGDRVRSTLHIHLDHDHCLEVIVLRGRSDEIKRAADRLLATRGVKHGGVEIVADQLLGEDEHAHPPHVHAYPPHDHAHPPHDHAHPPHAHGGAAPRRKQKAKRSGRRAAG
jgi:CopG family nickel-responsive transcriptional regulator